eukprot:1195924-Prorocentrum_minimum.AAC.6
MVKLTPGLLKSAVLNPCTKRPQPKRKSCQQSHRYTSALGCQTTVTRRAHQGTREHIPGVGTNRRGLERIAFLAQADVIETRVSVANSRIKGNLQVSTRELVRKHAMARK